MAADGRFVERLDAQAKVIQIAALRAGGCSASFAQPAVNGNQIDDRTAGTKLYQADSVLAFFHRATQGVAVKAEHGLEVDNTQDKMVDFADAELCRLPDRVVS